MILCDVMMPELDGYGVLQSLREDPATLTTPFTPKSLRAVNFIEDPLAKLDVTDRD